MSSTPTTTTPPAPAMWRRIAAYAIDWCVFAVWGLTVFLAVRLVGTVDWPSDPWASQAMGALFTTVPFALYFVAMESSRRRGTLGKRAFSLRVETPDGRRLPLGRAVVRTAAKLLPWEMAHTVVHHLMWRPAEAGFPTWLVGLDVLALTLVVVYVIGLRTRDGRTLYDHLAGSRVAAGPRPAP